jgi:excisionase family DNA binding protein
MTKEPLHWTEKLTLSAEEIAALTGLSRSGVYALIKDGKLPHVSINDRVLVRRETFERWLVERECVGRQATVSLAPRRYTKRVR